MPRYSLYVPRPERQLIERVRSLAQASGGSRRTLVTGIGDDCAVLRAPAGHEILVTTDFSLEGVHFRREWHRPESVGHRCLTRGLSDIAAMGGRPMAAFLSLALPDGLPQAWVDGFMKGLITLAKRDGVWLAGGDTAHSPAGVLADIIVLGSVPVGRALLRSGAKPGERIYVTGRLGESAAEIRRRYAEKSRQDPRDLSRAPKPAQGYASRSGRPGSRDINRFLFPEPRLDVGQRLRAVASSAIDISDGLSTDLSHICKESRVGAVVSTSAIPLADSATLDDALHGGDDYELLFTSSQSVPSIIAGVAVTQIGKTIDRPGVWIQDNRGKTKRLAAKGWEHFKRHSSTAP